MLIEAYDFYPSREIEQDKLLSSAHMLKGKVLFLYHPDKFLPLYNRDHLQTVLQRLAVSEKQYFNLDLIECNRLLRETVAKIEPLNKWQPIKLKDFFDQTFLNIEAGPRYFKIAPGLGATGMSG